MNTYYFSKKLNKYKFCVVNKKACELINTRLDQYQTSFKENGEHVKVDLNEAIFTVSQNDINFVKAVCIKFGGLNVHF